MVPCSDSAKVKMTKKYVQTAEILIKKMIKNEQEGYAKF